MIIVDFYNIELFETAFESDGTRHPIYGVSVTTSFGAVSVPAISRDKDQVIKIMELCRKHSVSPVHIEDVARDYLFSHN
ncbi:hypothetical protein FACS1894198_5700 [Clostridia bacterium]|nr:hypothetical protein FACS1894198_5700 [Clostridia bacterium]